MKERIKKVKEKIAEIEALLYAMQEDYLHDENGDYIKDENGFYKTVYRDNIVNQTLIEKAEKMLL